MGLFKSLTRKSRSRNKEPQQSSPPTITSYAPKLEPLTLKLDFESPLQITSTTATTTTTTTNTSALATTTTTAAAALSSTTTPLQRSAGRGLLDDIFSELDSARSNNKENDFHADLSLTLALSQQLDNPGSVAATSISKTSNTPATTVITTTKAAAAADDPLFGPDSIYSSYLASLKISTDEQKPAAPTYESKSMFASLLQPLNGNTASGTNATAGTSLLSSNTSAAAASSAVAATAAEPVTTQKVLDSDVSDSEEDNSQESSDDEPDIPTMGKGMAPILERRGPDHKLMVKRKVDSWRINSNPEAELAELNQDMIERMKDRHRQQYKIAAIRQQQQQQQQIVHGYGGVVPIPPSTADMVGGAPYMMPIVPPAAAPPHEMMMMMQAPPPPPPAPGAVPPQPVMPMQQPQPMPAPTMSTERHPRSKRSVPTSPSMSSASSTATTPQPPSSSASSTSSVHQASSSGSNIRITKKRGSSVSHDSSPTTYTDADDEADQEDNVSLSSEGSLTAAAATTTSTITATTTTAVEKKDFSNGDVDTTPSKTNIGTEELRCSVRYSRSLPNLKKKKKKAAGIRHDNNNSNGNDPRSAISSPAIRPQRSASTSTAAAHKIKHSKSNPDMQYLQQQPRQYYYPYHHQQTELHQEWDRMQAYQREQQLKQLYMRQFYSGNSNNNNPPAAAVRRSHQPSMMATYPLSPPMSPPVMHHHLQQQHFHPQQHPHSSMYMQGARTMYDPATPPMSPPFQSTNYYNPALH